jgi:hypothetical protein
MRQRNQIEVVIRALDAKFATDHFFQFPAIDTLRDGQTSDRNYEQRLEDLDFIIHPGRAIANLIRRRNTIAAARIFSGKASTDRREINPRANSGFIHSARFFEPAEKRFASGMRKRPLQNGFSGAGCLPNEYHIADYRAA